MYSSNCFMLRFRRTWSCCYVVLSSFIFVACLTVYMNIGTANQNIWKTEFGKINDYSREKCCTNPYFSFLKAFLNSSLTSYEDMRILKFQVFFFYLWQSVDARAEPMQQKMKVTPHQTQGCSSLKQNFCFVL